MPGRKIAVVTIGQSGRDDIARPFHDTGISDVVQAGALDGLSPEQLRELHPRPDEDTLITKLLDHTPIMVSKQRLHLLMQAAIGRVDALGANPVVLFCTGSFPKFVSSGLIIEPDRVLAGVVRSLRGVNRLGIVVPLPQQVEQIGARWRGTAAETLIRHANPFGDLQLIQEAAADLRGRVDVLVLDCMGYTEEAKTVAAQASGVPVVLSRTVVARVAAELAG